MKIKTPKGETVWVTYYNSHHIPVYVMTSKASRDYYYLYEVMPNGEVNKLGRAHSPTELEGKYNVSKGMG